MYSLTNSSQQLIRATAAGAGAYLWLKATYTLNIPCLVYAASDIVVVLPVCLFVCLCGQNSLFLSAVIMYKGNGRLQMAQE